jgi:hypothetical protein
MGQVTSMKEGSQLEEFLIIHLEGGFRIIPPKKWLLKIGT